MSTNNSTTDKSSNGEPTREELNTKAAISEKPEQTKPPEFEGNPTVGGIALSDLILTPDKMHGEVVKLVSELPIKKPNKKTFVRCHPDEEYQMPCLLYVDEEGMDKMYYWIMPELHEHFDGMARGFILRLGMSRVGATREGALFIWPLTIPDEAGSAGVSWHRSMLAAAAAAEIGWVRVISNKAESTYNIIRPLDPSAMPEPDWPTTKFAELLDKTFGTDHIVADANHPIIQKLKGAA